MNRRCERTGRKGILAQLQQDRLRNFPVNTTNFHLDQSRLTTSIGITWHTPPSKLNATQSSCLWNQYFMAQQTWKLKAHPGVLTIVAEDEHNLEPPKILHDRQASWHSVAERRSTARDRLSPSRFQQDREQYCITVYTTKSGPSSCRLIHAVSSSALLAAIILTDSI